VATACRLGELLALRWLDVRVDSVLVRHSLERGTGELKSTKTAREREVPVPTVVSGILRSLGPASPEEFVFAGSATPLPHHRAAHRFRRALTAIGLTREQQLERAVSFHSLRHMANSLLRGRVADETLRMVTGHATPEMTELYSHTLQTHLEDVRAAQEAVFPQLTRPE
jgi:integrase